MVVAKLWKVLWARNVRIPVQSVWYRDNSHHLSQYPILIAKGINSSPKSFPSMPRWCSCLWLVKRSQKAREVASAASTAFYHSRRYARQATHRDIDFLQAAEFPPGSYERLIHVACFAVSGYASTAGRTSKPFNPLLGETYEFVCPEKGLRFISEKVRGSSADSSTHTDLCVILCLAFWPI